MITWVSLDAENSQPILLKSQASLLIQLLGNASLLLTSSHCSLFKIDIPGAWSWLLFTYHTLVEKLVQGRTDQVVWYSHLLKNFPQFIVIHTVKGFGIVNKAEIDVFLELSCFFHDPADVGNLISGSSAFSISVRGDTSMQCT